MALRRVLTNVPSYHVSATSRSRSSKASHRSLSTDSYATLSRYTSLEWKDHKQTHNPLGIFNIVTFNLLAPCYKRLKAFRTMNGQRDREADNYHLWLEREEETIDFLEKHIFPMTSIIALQEFWLEDDYLNIFQQVLDIHGYQLHKLQRTKLKLDAVALAVKKDIFTVMGIEHIPLYTGGDRVALLVWVKHKHTGKDVLIANTHLSFPHSECDVLNQTNQMKRLTNVMDHYAMNHHISHSTKIIVGDFNVVNDSLVCQHLRHEGYYSCMEISPPKNLDTTTEYTTLRHESRSSPSSSSSSSSSYQSTNDRILKLCRLHSNRPIKPLMPLQDHNNDHDHDHHHHLLVNDSPIARNSINFVSHHTHRSEDLGVDHIFYKPEFEFMVIDSNHDHSRQPSKHNLIHVDKENQDLPVKCIGSVFVDSTEVIPHTLPGRNWETSFQISDHRPIGASLVIGRKKDI